MRFSWILVTLLGVMGAASPASAGGFDTPILYSARHIGMGGTAVATVDDASAGFHNPAGFGAIGKANVIANFSPIIGSLRSSPNMYTGGPDAGQPLNVTSDNTFAPFFLLGGAVRVWDYLSFGATIFPVASAGATYNYSTDPTNPEGSAVRDYTKLVFLEIAPGFAFNYDAWGLRLGMTWRINTVALDRERSGASPLDLHVGGVSLAGIRVGAQWDVPWVEGLSFGLHYRSKVRINADKSSASSALGLDLAEANQDWTLPSRLSFGASHKIGTMRVSADAEYGFQSQNERGDISVVVASGGEVTLPNVYAWKNQWTLRGGIEYGVYEDRIPVRVGFIWDQRTSNPSYASAFGAPPAANYALTAGTGYRVDGHRVNFAAVYRWGKGEATAAQIASPNPDYGACNFCAFAGTYVIKMAGLYLDYSYDF